MVICGKEARSDPVTGVCVGEEGELVFCEGRCVCSLTSDSSVCVVCPAGRFGSGCSQRCDCSNRGLCDAVSGNCSCGLGWTGLRCERGMFIIYRVHNVTLTLPLIVNYSSDWEKKSQWAIDVEKPSN